jgi:HEAT repeat protein
MNAEKRAAISDCEAFFGELIKSIKSSFMYPPSHPSLIKSYENTYAVFRDFIDRVEEFTITVGKEGLILDDTSFGQGDDSFKKFSHDLARKNIHRLTFKHAITLEEFQTLIQLLSMNDQMFRSKGGAQSLFQEKNIKNVAAKELEYDDFLKDTIPTDEDGEGEDAPEAPVEDDIQEVIEEEGEVVEDEDTILIEQINEYTSQLSREKDIQRFKKLLLTLLRLIENLVAEGKTNHVLTILIAIAKEALPAKKRPKRFQQLCFQAIRKCATDDIIEKSLNRFAQRDEKQKGELTALLKIIGSDTVTPALNKLIEHEDAIARRNLIQLLISFGEIARPKVEIFLFDERWFVVRNMAMILGEIGSEKSINPLSRVINHRDFKVQREVVHSLSKIGGKYVPGFLLRVLDDAPEQFALIIINALGVLGNPVAIEPLIDIATRREIFYRNYELRKHAIHSLTRLKARDAVEALGKIALKGEFLGGIRNEDLRITATRALGRIGGENAIEFLTRIVKKRNRNVRRAAEAALAALGHAYERPGK